MENLKTLINKKPFILYEYYCPIDDKFFWSKELLPQLTCPYCKKIANINGEILIEDIKITNQEFKKNI